MRDEVELADDFVCGFVVFEVLLDDDSEERGVGFVVKGGGGFCGCWDVDCKFDLVLGCSGVENGV